MIPLVRQSSVCHSRRQVRTALFSLPVRDKAPPLLWDWAARALAPMAYEQHTTCWKIKNTMLRKSMANVSEGPLPLRLLLVCDGTQVIDLHASE